MIVVAETVELYSRAVVLSLLTLTITTVFDKYLNRSGDPEATDGDMIFENFDRMDFAMILQIEAA